MNTSVEVPLSAVARSPALRLELSGACFWGSGQLNRLLVE